jgi:hypothetical protein
VAFKGLTMSGVLKFFSAYHLETQPKEVCGKRMPGMGQINPILGEGGRHLLDPHLPCTENKQPSSKEEQRKRRRKRKRYWLASTLQNCRRMRRNG